jgi:hypothetical protein
MRKTIIAFAVVSAFFIAPANFAAEKLKIEVVEATQSFLSMGGGPKPAIPEKKETHCKTNEKDGEKSQDCTTVTTPAVPASYTPAEAIVTYTAKVILPDGTHALLQCEGFYDGCGKIVSATPERTKQKWAGSSETTTGLGSFEAKRNKDEITIYTASGKRKYKIVGSW